MRVCVCLWASARARCGIMQIALLMYSEIMSTNNQALDSHHFCRNHSGGSIALKNFIFACKRLLFFFLLIYSRKQSFIIWRYHSDSRKPKIYRGTI